MALRGVVLALCCCAGLTSDWGEPLGREAPPAAAPRHAATSDHAYVFLGMGDAVARDLPTAVVALLATNTTADVVVFAWRVSPRNRNRLAALVRLIELTDRQMTSCPHKVTRKGTLNSLQQYSCSKVPLLLSLSEYKRVIFVDADMMVMANFDHLFGIPLKPNGMAGSGNPLNTQELDEHGIVRHSLNGALMLIEPSVEHHETFIKYIKGFRGGQSERGDQVLTKDYFEKRKTSTYIPVAYNWGLWNSMYHHPVERGLYEMSRRQPPFGVHFSGKYKPWLPPTSTEHKIWVSAVPARYRAFAEQYGCVWAFFAEIILPEVSDAPSCSSSDVHALVKGRWQETIDRCFDSKLLPDTSPYTRTYPYSISLDYGILQ